LYFQSKVNFPSWTSAGTRAGRRARLAGERIAAGKSPSIKSPEMSYVLRQELAAGEAFV